MHHITALPPCSSCLQEAAEGVTPSTRPVKSHSSYLCFLRLAVSTATKLLQARTTAGELFARLKQQNFKHYSIACGLSNKLHCDCFSILSNSVKIKLNWRSMKIPTGCTKPQSSHVKMKPVSSGNGTEMQ